MKKNIRKLLYMLVAVVLVTSCEWEPIVFDSSKSYIAFQSTSTGIPEQGGAVPIVVQLTALLDAPATTVEFEFDTTGILLENAAFEGVDYTLVNDSKQLSFPDGWGYDTIWIQPVDNDIFTGNKKFNIHLTVNSQDYPFGEANSHTITLNDNEHPLGDWIGTYSVVVDDYASYFGDESWTVVTAPDPSDVNNLIMTGWGGPEYGEHYEVVAAVDMEAMTITIPGGTEIGVHGQYGGPLAIFVGDEAGNVVSEDEAIVGTIAADGSMLIDHVAIRFVGGNNEGLDWGSFKTIWTKTAKKSLPAVAPMSQVISLEQ